MINSHYIPQFILKNFLSDDKLTYCDKQKKTIELRNTRSVFCEKGYYPDNIEKDLCYKVEYLFANLYHNKLENVHNSLDLSSEELFLIKKYLIVSAIRYKYNTDSLANEILELEKENYRINRDNSLNAILSCNDKNDLNKKIDEYNDYVHRYYTGDNHQTNFDVFLSAELKDIVQSYIIFVKPRCDERFAIPDIGRCTYQGPLGMKKGLIISQMLMINPCPEVYDMAMKMGPRDYSIYPISSNLAIVSMSSFYRIFAEHKDGTKNYSIISNISDMLGLEDISIFKGPRLRIRSGAITNYHYDIVPLKLKDMCHINCLFFSQAEAHIACAGLETIQKSIENVNKYTDSDFSFMKIVN